MGRSNKNGGKIAEEYNDMNYFTLSKSEAIIIEDLDMRCHLEKNFRIYDKIDIHIFELCGEFYRMHAN